MIQHASSFFFDNKLELQRTFRLIDVDNSGKVDLDEFKEGIQFLNLQLESPLSGRIDNSHQITHHLDLQIDELYRALDKDGDGFVNYEDFLKSFSVVDTLENTTPRFSDISLLFEKSK
jgi:Ca2+-binding EF-hand superfamily protein